MAPFVLAIIPARGGSKGIPDKNIRLLGGKPLIHHSVLVAKAATSIDDVVVTSDSEKILDCARQAGADELILRPKELATDATPTIDALLHALAQYEKNNNRQVDYMLLLQPTTPLRLVSDIDGAVAMMLNEPQADTLISAYDASHVHPAIMYRLEGQYGVPFYQVPIAQRRQDFEKVLVRNGAIYLAKREYLLREKRTYSDRPLVFEMPRERSINIDEELDLHIAEAILKARV